MLFRDFILCVCIVSWCVLSRLVCAEVCFRFVGRAEGRRPRRSRLTARSRCRRAREKMRTGEKLELFDGKGIIELLSKYHGEAPLPFCPNRKK
jgi:hypothetical protein